MSDTPSFDLRGPASPELIAYFRTPEGRAELDAYFHTPEGARELRVAVFSEIHAAQPRFATAVRGDARVFMVERYDREPRRGVGFLLDLARLAWETDTFLALLLYRLRVRLIVRRIPILPGVLHRVCIFLAQMSFGGDAVVQPGLHLLHGQVVIDGLVKIGPFATIAPWVTLGRKGPAFEGPSIGSHAFIGTGAKLLGPITIGDHVLVGANAVVVHDVPSYATVAGVPASIIKRGGGAESQDPATSARTG